MLSLFLNFKFDTKILKSLAKIIVPVVGAFFVFSMISAIQGGKGTSVVKVLWERVEPIIYDKGVHSTNRSYVYRYFEEAEVPILGDGLGNSNIKFSRHVGIEATVSFLNLFLNISFSLGVIGLLIVLVFLAYPLIYFILVRSSLTGVKPIFLMASYVAWLFIFFMHSEEFSLYFAIIYGLLIHQLLFRKEEAADV